MIEDEIYWDAHEELIVKNEKEPNHEEILEHLENKFKNSEEEKLEYYRRKIYGK